MSDDSKSWDTRYEWKAVLLLALGFGLVGLDRWVIADVAGSRGSTMVPDLHMSNPAAAIGSLIAALGVAWGVTALVAGNISDRLGRKKVLVPALVLFSLMSAFSGLVGSVIALMGVRILMGVFEGAYCPTSFASVVEATKPSRRGLNLGLQQSAFALFGLGFGPIIATQLLAHMGWRWVFAIVGVPGLIIALLVALTIREPSTLQVKAAHEPEAPPVKFNLALIFKHRNVPLSMVALLCAMCGIFVLSAFTPAYLTGYLKLTDQQMGFVASAIGFGGTAGNWFLCGFSDIFGRKIMAILGFLVGAAFLWLFMHMGASNLPLLFVVLFICAGFPFGLLSLITGPIASEAAPLGLIASTSGVIIGVGEIFGGGFAPAIAGGIAGKWGIQYTLVMALVGLLIGVVVSLFYKETAPAKTKGGVSDLDKLEERTGSVTAG